jgi:superfamily II DNA or RNA helicase
MTLPDGLDLLLTQSLESRLDLSRADVRAIDAGAADYLVDALARQLAEILEDVGEGEESSATRQLELVNALLVKLRQRLAQGATGRAAAEVIDLLAAPPRLLKAVGRGGQFPASPSLGLAAPWLFTAGARLPSLLHEIRHELASADQVDLMMSFITVSGERKLRDVLQQITAVSASGSGTRLRILTTTYIGATEARALDELARLPNCEVRVSLDGRRTRLHAKAWIFHRRSGFGSAYVGSANLSGAALSGGLEWTVKLTQRGQEALFTRATAHFETLWADSEFEPYDPDRPEHRQALAAALKRDGFNGDESGAISFFDLQPKTYQQEMLEQLAAERSHGRRRNLLVAATGTGKTVVAAFDYRNVCREVGGLPRLLFVAHREEILRQARRTFREVLRLPDFGESLGGGEEPQRLDHLFATIDSVSSRGLVAQAGAGHWHMVIVDECHRLAADRFDAFVTAIQPRLLLGLTATPERSDGQPITRYFDMRPDGSPAVELRLWHALDLQLLAPFEYYACDDATDFSDVPWDRAGEREAVDRLVGGNATRAALVVNEWRRLVAQPAQGCALVFCVSVAHAEFMTGWLNRAGLPAACLVGTTPADERRSAPQRLARGELLQVMTDLFNEASTCRWWIRCCCCARRKARAVQQQIGRGRLAPGKDSCLVLDFVGQHRADFRFDRLLSSLTGQTRRELVDSVEHGFGSLPPGCHIQLQRQTREQVLRGLRELTSQNWRRLSGELQAYAALRGRASVQLADFLHEQALELEDVYRSSTGAGRSGWTALQRDAGLIAAEPGPEEAYFSRRFGDLLHVDDPLRLDAMAAIGRGQHDARDPRQAGLAQMLAYQIDGRHEQSGAYQAFIERLRNAPANRSELSELSALLQSSSTLPATPLPGLEDTPLCLHAAYGVREVLTAVGWLTAKRSPFQAGVLPLRERRTESCSSTRWTRARAIPTASPIATTRSAPNVSTGSRRTAPGRTRRPAGATWAVQTTASGVSSSSSASPKAGLTGHAAL